MTARILLLTAVATMLGACASATRQADEVLRAPDPTLPMQAFVAGVPFVKQAAAQCGPATLTMAMGFAGQDVAVEELLPQVYSPAKKGTLPTDMVSATRRHGLVGVEIKGLSALLREVAAGHPVIIFENLAFSWLPQWHYAVVFGYDLNAETVTLHSGPEQNKIWDIRKFERSWKLADYWGLVVLPAGQLTATGGEVAHVAAAAGLEQAAKAHEAEMTYAKILHHWPQSLGALVGLANLAYQKNEFARAEKYLQKATQFHPQSRIARHNLVVVQEHIKNRRSNRTTP